MNSSELISVIVNKINDSRQDENKHLEKLIRNNYTNLSGQITEIKNGMEKIKESDRAQDMEIVGIKKDIENNVKGLDSFKELEKSYGRQFNKKIDDNKTEIEKKIESINNRPWKIIGVVFGACTILGTLIGGIIYMLNI